MQNYKIDKKIFIWHGVGLAYLFGSKAKGIAKEESDFDIAALFEEDQDDLTLFDKATLLKEDLRSYFPAEVDIVVLNNASSLLKYEVIASGILLYALNENSRINFEVLAIKQYIDDKFIRDTYYTALQERVLKGEFL